MKTLNYYEHPFISQSRLKTYLQSDLLNLWASLKIETKETEAQRFGKIVDVLITTESEFNKLYVILEDGEENPVSKEQKQFIKFVADGLALEDAYKDAYKGAKNKKDSEITKAAKDLYTKFTQHIALYNDPRIKLSNEEYVIACNIVANYLEHPITKKLIALDYPSLNQLELYWDCRYTGIGLKAKLDSFFIDHANKLVYIVDYKTTNDVGDSFSKASDKYWYGFQLAFYYEGALALNLIPNNYEVNLVICGLQKEFPHSCTYYKYMNVENYTEGVKSAIIKLAVELNQTNFDLYSNSIPKQVTTDFINLY
jgi:hypothetical protein